MSDGNCYKDLPIGTILVLRDHKRPRIRLVETMRGIVAHVMYVNKDGTRDRRRYGWTGSLPKYMWKVASDGQSEVPS